MSECSAAYRLARDELIECLSLIQLEIVELRRLTAPLKDVQVIPDEATLRPVAEAVTRLATQRDALAAPLAQSPTLGAIAAAAVETLRRRIDATRRDAAALDPASLPADSAAFRAAVTLARTRLDEAYDASLELTVPYQARTLLSDRRVGKPLAFIDVFARGQAPSAERRTEMLQELALRAGYLNEGVIDVSRGIIWRRSGSAAIRLLSCLSPIVFAAVAAGLLLLISDVAETPRLDDRSVVFDSYVIVLLGTVAHLLVENVKLSQAADSPILAIGDFVDWLHLRWASIGATFFAIVVAVIGLRLTLPEESLKPGWQTTLLFFFAGYSVDSVAGIFLNRFGTAAPTAVGAVTAAIQPPPDNGTS
jgi:hypothetical protein